jgi:DNA-binding transcriptional regulator GbsR (MarR family)
MKLESAKLEFMLTWGNFASQWGINRTMAQIHALLLVSDEPQCTDEIMKTLTISRGNANMNIRELLTWNLIYKANMTGDRKEYFRAEKDMWEVAKRIIKERNKRELVQLQQHLTELKKVEQSYESISFVATIENIERMIQRMDNVTNLVMKADEHAIFGKIIQLLK